MRSARPITFAAAAVLLGLAAAVPLLSADPPPGGRKVAVLVGVRAYDHSGLPDLEFTERDVTDLADVLRPAGYAVTLLTTAAPASRKPTADNIRAALATALKGVTKHDTVVVALAGHGLQPDGSKESYFCPQDANPTLNDGPGGKAPANPDTLVGLTALVDQLNDSGVGVKLLLVDACRNDPTSGRGRGADGARMAALPRGVAALFSCSEGQRAFETAKAGGGHGVFFHFVLEGLRGKAANDRGEVTWTRLAEYVQENVETRVPEWIGGGARQIPHEVKNLAGRSPSLLALEGSTIFSAATGMMLVRIRAGTFLMGSPEHEKDRELVKNAEHGETRHQVTLTKDFYLGVYEVTKGQFEMFVRDTGYKTQGEAGTSQVYTDAVQGFSALDGKDQKDFNWRTPGFPQLADHPVVNVTYSDAAAFIDWLSRKDGQTYRLPTEAEWEYACRAGTTTRYHFGDDDTLLATEANAGTVKRTVPSRYFRPNRFGLYDMHGNVNEMCSDFIGAFTAEKAIDPQGLKPGPNRYRVVKGGSFFGGSGMCRSAYRGACGDSQRANDMGFRLVRVPSVR